AAPRGRPLPPSRATGISSPVCGMTPDTAAGAAGQVVPPGGDGLFGRGVGRAGLPEKAGGVPQVFFDGPCAAFPLLQPDAVGVQCHGRLLSAGGPGHSMPRPARKTPDGAPAQKKDRRSRSFLFLCFPALTPASLR